MSTELKPPPLKKRKLNQLNNEQKSTNTNESATQCVKCVWCNTKPITSNKTNIVCNCNEIASSLKSSPCHKIIEINNAGNGKSKFKCYKLLRSDPSEQKQSKQQKDLFQIDCKHGNINFDSMDFQNKLSNSLESNGIVILRNLFSQKQVLDAKYDILTKYLLKFIVSDTNDKDLTMKCQLNDSSTSNASPSLLNKAIEVIENTKSVKQILEHEKLFKIVSILLNSEHIITTKYKWLRCVAPSLFTGLHFDKMYMGSETFDKMLSIWIPFGDINTTHGSLIWCYGSHKCEKWNTYLDSINYGNPKTLNKDGTSSGWITDNLCDYFNENNNNNKQQKELCAGDHLTWTTTDFEAGDIAIFGLKLIHQTLRNDTNCYRLSCDTRWTPICQPLDNILQRCGVSKGFS